VHVLALRHNPNLPSWERHGRLSVHRAPLVGHYVQPLSRFQRRLGGVLAYSLSALASTIAERDFDVYYFNQYPYLHAAAALPFLFSKPHVVDWCEVRQLGHLSMMFEYFISKVATAHTAVSDVQSRLLRLAYSVNDEKICTIPDGVTLERYRPDRNLKTPDSVLYLGRLAPHKQLDLLVEGSVMAHNSLPNLTLNIAGGGDMMEKLRGATQPHDFIRLWGPVSEETKTHLLEAASVFVLTSAREGFSITAAEAVASGTPVLTVDEPINVTKELVKSWGAGLVVKPTAQAVAAGLRQLLRDAETWDRAHQNCLRVRSSLGWESSAQKLERFLSGWGKP
jgi:glycosyltransferase involved in cell wall biosynthesis